MLDSVIVVDDEASIRTAVEQWLSLSGFDVQLYSCAEDCLSHLPAHFAGVSWKNCWTLRATRLPSASKIGLIIVGAGLLARVSLRFV